MLTYTTSRNLFGSLASNTDSSTLTLADVLINNAIREVLSIREWPFLEKNASISTVASTQFYNLPFDYGKLINLTVTSGTTIYSPREVTSRDQWDKLNYSSFSSSVPEYYFIYGNTVGIWPTPSTTTSNAITVYYNRRTKDLSIADYSTGTITSIAAAGTAVVGSGTTWTSKMIGRYIRITDSNTANTGDGVWYEITAVGSTTTLTLARPYDGLAIAAGSAAYVIGQSSVLSEEYQTIPIYRATEIYFTSVQPEPERAQMYKVLYQEGIQRMIAEASSKSTSVSLSNDGYPIVNPNLMLRY